MQELKWIAIVLAGRPARADAEEAEHGPQVMHAGLLALGKTRPQAMQRDPPELLHFRRLRRSLQGQHIHAVSPLRKRLGIARDARIHQVIRMGDHAHPDGCAGLLNARRGGELGHFLRQHVPVSARIPGFHVFQKLPVQGNGILRSPSRAPVIVKCNVIGMDVHKGHAPVFCHPIELPLPELNARFAKQQE